MSNTSSPTGHCQLSTANSFRRRVVHLPCYDVNPYQRSLMHALNQIGWDTLDGGGGGNFLRSALFRWHCDAIHFHWLHPYIVRSTRLGSVFRGLQLILELLILRLAGKRLVWTVHNLHNHQGQHRDVERWTYRWVSRIVHQIICHSQYAADCASVAYGASRVKMAVTPHPRWDQYPNTTSSKAGRDQLGLDWDAPVFLLIGRVAPYKGVEDLISAFRQLSDRSARLIIAGGSISDEYEDVIRDLSRPDHRIQLHLRFIEDHEMQVFMNAADVVVFPFQEILTSGSVLLAMEFGKPCIVPAIGAIPEVLPGEQHALVYDPQIPESLTKRLLSAIDMRPQLPAIGAANARRAIDWTWMQLASTCASLYDKHGAVDEVENSQPTGASRDLNVGNRNTFHTTTECCERSTA